MRDSAVKETLALLAFGLLLAIIAFAGATYGAEPESFYANELARVIGGESHRLPDGTTVDVLTENLAIEVDFAGFKVWEALGQSLWYAKQTGRKPAVYLLLRDDAGLPWVERARELYPDQGVLLFVRDVREPTPTPEPVPTPDDPLTRPLVAEADIEYVGSFNVALLPSSPFTDGGLSHRFEGDALRLLLTHHPGAAGVYEIAVPEPSLDPDPANWKTAQVTKDYGGIAQPLREAVSNGWVGSVHWHDGRIIVGARDVYNARAVNWPSYIVYDPATGETGEPLANEGGLSHPALGVGVTSIPQWFADQYTGGADLLVGNGYRVSGQGFHYGPCFAAAKIADGKLVSRTLVQFPPSQTPERRPGNYTPGHAEGHWLHPMLPDENGVGYITAADHVRDTAVWVDLPDKHGLLLIPTLGTGEIAYRNARIECGGFESYWYVYDPAEIAEAAQGTRKPWDVRAKSWWRFEQKGASGTFSEDTTNPTHRGRVMGATLVDRTLYVLVKGGGKKSGIYTVLGVHCYRIK